MRCLQYVYICCYLVLLVTYAYVSFFSTVAGAVPAEIGDLIKLETLDLGSNEIEEIPVSVGRLVNLKVKFCCC